MEFLRALSQRTEPNAEVVVPFAGDQRWPRVFVSGSYHQIELLRKVGEVVKRAGFDVWLAETQVSPGDRIVDEISKAIDEADCLIAVLSDAAAQSSWVHFEIGRAFGARKPVLPIRIGDAQVPLDLMGLFYLQVKGPQLTPEDEALITVSLRRLLDTATNN